MLDYSDVKKAKGLSAADSTRTTKCYIGRVMNVCYSTRWFYCSRLSVKALSFGQLCLRQDRFNYSVTMMTLGTMYIARMRVK